MYKSNSILTSDECCAKVINPIHVEHLQHGLFKNLWWRLCTSWRLSYILTSIGRIEEKFYWGSKTFFWQLWILFRCLYCSTQMSVSVLLSLINQTAHSTLPPQYHEWVLVVLGSYNCMYTYTLHGSCIVRYVASVWAKFFRSFPREWVCSRPWISKQVDQKCVCRWEYWKCCNFEMQ